MTKVLQILIQAFENGVNRRYRDTEVVVRPNTKVVELIYYSKPIARRYEQRVQIYVSRTSMSTMDRLRAVVRYVNSNANLNVVAGKVVWSVPGKKPVIVPQGEWFEIRPLSPLMQLAELGHALRESDGI